MRKSFNVKQLVIALLFIIAPLLLLHQHRDKPVVTKNVPASSKNTPNWFAKNVTSTLYDEAGAPEKILSAKTLTHFENTQNTLISAPLFTLYVQQDAPPWILDAKLGIAHHGHRIDQINEIDLNQHVLLSRAAGKSNAPMSMTTEHLQIYPDKHIAKSNDTVFFKQPGQTMTGVGMIAHLDTDTIELLHRVRGHHESA